MPDVRIKLPEGVEVDKTRLTSAIRFAVDGGAPDKIWRMNNVPAIAQLEEATYAEGRQDLALLYYEVTTGLDLPDHESQVVLAKALADFQEQQHPREAAGEAMAGYKPGEFVPKDTGTPAPAETAEPAVADDAEIARLRQGAEERIASIAKLMKLSGAEKKVELQGRIDRIRQEVEEEVAAHQAGAAPKEAKPKTEPLRPPPKPPVGDGLTRTGGRPLPPDLGKDELREQFGFGETLGHVHLSEELRRQHIEGATGAFMDLADVLGLDDREMGLTGKLNFDVRSAAYAAACEFQNDTRTLVIKTTDGAALAHEWWHAVDNAVGRQIEVGGLHTAMATQTRRKDLVDPDPGPVVTAFRDLVHTINRSRFFRNAQEIERDYAGTGPAGYWTCPPETTARAFEIYVEDKLAAQGRKNTYLVDTSRGNPLMFPPEGDRAEIAGAFDRLWAAMRENRAMLKALASILTDDDGEAIADDLAKAFGFGRKVKVAPGQVALDFQEDDHPREKAGETLAGYKPGEFIPKHAQGQAGDEPSAKEEAPLPSYEDQLADLQDRFTRANQALEAKRAALGEKQKETSDPVEKAAIQKEVINCLDEQGVGFRRFRNQVGRLQALMAGSEPMPDWDERRGEARKLMDEYRELGRQFVPMSDPRRTALHTKAKAMFLQADQAEGMTPTYLKHQADLARQEAAELRRPLTQQIIDAADDDVRADLMEKLNAISEASIHRENEFENRAEWLQEDEAARMDADLREILGEKGYQARKAEEAATEAYKKANPKTNLGYDRRQVGDPKAHNRSWKGRWGGAYDLTDEECERRGVPPGTKHVYPAMEEVLHHTTLIGGDAAYYGPVKQPEFRKECDAMRERVNKAFPEWMRDHLAAKGVTQNYCAASPARTQFANQREFYDWLKDNPEMRSKVNPDCGGGVYYPSKRAAFTQVGHSFPGENHGSASLCVEIHEYAHALDYNFRENGQPIHTLDEWHQILSDLHAHLDWYNQEPPELFAEGLTAFLYSPKARKQMLQGPPQWRRMGKFFQQLMDAKTGPEFIKKSLWACDFGKALDTTEEAGEGDDKQKLPAGFVWKPGMMVPAPDGNGFMIVDGYGPDEGH